MFFFPGRVIFGGSVPSQNFSGSRNDLRKNWDRNGKNLERQSPPLVDMNGSMKLGRYP